MKPLVVVDLMAHTRDYAPMVVAAHHKFTAPERPVRRVGLGAEWDDSFAEAGGIQVTGSTDMVQDVDWADDLCKALVASARRRVPVLGICFGHQMLGAHFGATLESWDKPCVGVASISCQASGPFIEEELEILLTHRDRLVSLGPALTPVASGGFGGIQAWAHRELPMWGIQGHPEADAALARRAEGGLVEAIPNARLQTPAAKGILARFGALMQ